MKHRPHVWTRMQLSDIATEVNERASIGEQPPVLSMSKHSGFVESLQYFKKRVFSQDTSNYKVVRRGDFAYATIHLDEGSIDQLSKLDAGLISPMYTVFRPDNTRVDGKFLRLFLKSPQMLESYGRLGQGSVNRRKSITFDLLSTLRLAFPPLPEQRRISTILASADDAVESALATLRQARVIRGKLVDLLLAAREKGHTGGKGSRKRPTGGWRERPLGDLLAAIEAGRSPSSEGDPATSDAWGVLKVSAVGSHGFLPKENKQLPANYEVPATMIVRSGDILITRANTAALVGAVVRVPEGEYRLMLSDKTLRLVPTAEIMPEFLALTLSSGQARRYFRDHATGTSGSMKNIGQKIIRQLPVAVPPKSEQAQIVEQLLHVDQVVLESEATAAIALKVKRGLQADLLSGRVRVKV